MLTKYIVQQMIDECETHRLDPDSVNQKPELVIFHTAQKRAELHNRDAQIADAVFSFWSWCFPGFPQDGRYTSFMKDVHRHLFDGKDDATVERNARAFFTEDYLRLGLHECVLIVNTPDTLDARRDGKSLTMFDPKMLPRKIVPTLQGVVYFKDF